MTPPESVGLKTIVSSAPTVAMASRKEQSLSQTPSFVSTSLVTTVPYSYAPMSHCAPIRRVMPRWSRLLTGDAAQVVSSPASITGEPESGARVWVGPPLSLSVSRLGSPLREAEQDASSTRLLVLV